MRSNFIFRPGSPGPSKFVYHWSVTFLFSCRNLPTCRQQRATDTFNKYFQHSAWKCNCSYSKVHQVYFLSSELPHGNFTFFFLLHNHVAIFPSFYNSFLHKSFLDSSQCLVSQPMAQFVCLLVCFWLSQYPNSKSQFLCRLSVVTNSVASQVTSKFGRLKQPFIQLTNLPINN